MDQALQLASTSIPTDGRWTDPRGNPSPVCARTRTPANSREELMQLLSLSRPAHISALQSLTSRSSPLPAPPAAARSATTALQIAIDARFHDLVLLLLCTGYRLELEPRNPLDQALERRSWDLVDLLL